jgi:ABC-type uncharacterized transport system permease subunit
LGWGLLFGALLSASYAILLKEGKWGLIKLVILLGMFTGVFWVLARINFTY